MKEASTHTAPLTNFVMPLVAVLGAIFGFLVGTANGSGLIGLRGRAWQHVACIAPEVIAGLRVVGEELEGAAIEAGDELVFHRKARLQQFTQS